MTTARGQEVANPAPATHRPGAAPDRARRGSTELLGQSDDEALGATHEAEPVAVLVLRDLADEFGTVAAKAESPPGERRAFEVAGAGFEPATFGL